MVQDRSKKKDIVEQMERLALRNKVKEEEYSEIYGGLREENVFARPNGLRENAETAISCRGHVPARTKKEVYG